MMPHWLPEGACLWRRIETLSGPYYVASCTGTERPASPTYPATCPDCDGRLWRSDCPPDDEWTVRLEAT